MGHRDIVRERSIRDFRMNSLHCPSCALQLQRRLLAVQGVEEVEVNFLEGMVRVIYDPGDIGSRDLERAVSAIGRQIAHAEEEHDHANERLTAASGLLLAGGAVAYLSGNPLLGIVKNVAVPLSGVLFGLGAVLGGFPVLRRAAAELRRRLLGIDLLVSIAIMGALALGETFEAAALAFLFGLAEWLEERAAARARRSIRDLLDRAPKRVTVLRDGRELELPVEAVSPGEVILVRPGETIGLDGVVARGRSSVSEAAITGESTPVTVEEGDPVYAGTLVEDGSLEIRVARPARESTLARIAALVEEAQHRKAPVERFVDRFARYYTPTVVGIAVLVALVPSLLGLPARTWILRALMLLVIACPCALAISTPVAMVSALVAAAKRGILAKGAAVLEAIAGVRFLALDKTGTLTTGELRAEVFPLDGADPGEILRIAAALERGSEHPIARAIRALAGDGDSLPDVEDFRALPGRGVRGRIGGEEYVVGRPELFRTLPDGLRQKPGPRGEAGDAHGGHPPLGRAPPRGEGGARGPEGARGGTGPPHRGPGPGGPTGGGGPRDRGGARRPPPRGEALPGGGAPGAGRGRVRRGRDQRRPGPGRRGRGDRHGRHRDRCGHRGRGRGAHAG